MLKKLKKIEMELYWIDDKGDRHKGCPAGITGNVSWLTGNVSWIRGDVSWIRGDVSGLTGNVSGLTGNVSGLTGDVDDCEISEEERKNGIDIEDLIVVTD